MATRRPTAPRSTPRTAGAAGRSAAPRQGAGRGPGGTRSSRPASSSTRPAAAARGRSSATASAERRRTRGPRVLVLSAVALMLAIFLVPSLQKWLEQRSEIGRLNAQISQQQQDLAQSQADVERWKDDSYVITQARERLHFVMPGEVPYIVDGDSDADDVSPQQAATSVPKPAAAWYENIWESMRLAGNPGAAVTDSQTPGLGQSSSSSGTNQ